MGSLRNSINRAWTYQGMKNLGVTEQEYGATTAEYRFYTLLTMAEAAVKSVFGMPSTSQTNIDKAKALIAPTTEEK